MVTCKACHTNFYAFDPFWDISLSLENSNNIEGCLNKFFNADKI